MSSAPQTIGILALQGSFAEHAEMVKKIGAIPHFIRSFADTKGVAACILPGGESTVMKKLLKSTGLDAWLIKSAKKGMPLYGTCAGLIVLADLGLIDIEVDRNAYGPQLYSFEDTIQLFTPYSLPAIFIRAPKIIATGSAVQVLAVHQKTPVWARQGRVFVSSFHPELTKEPLFYKTWLA